MILAPPHQLRRQEQETTSNNTLFILGLFNTTSYDWTVIFNVTMTLIQERKWRDDILEDDDTKLEWEVADSACDEHKALKAYWNLKTTHLVHGVVGTRCSDASITTARITGLENVTQVSPSATASTLSDKVSSTCPLTLAVLLVLVSDQVV
jgi:hypothetical protein